jgi:hypothetical protein
MFVSVLGLGSHEVIFENESNFSQFMRQFILHSLYLRLGRSKEDLATSALSSLRLVMMSACTVTVAVAVRATTGVLGGRRSLIAPIVVEWSRVE